MAGEPVSGTMVGAGPPLLPSAVSRKLATPTLSFDTGAVQELSPSTLWPPDAITLAPDVAPQPLWTIELPIAPPAAPEPLLKMAAAPPDVFPFTVTNRKLSVPPSR